ncbi:hypothetical protein [uncultured Phocaeicola sp.]|jgi:putative ABC transport system permease protein|uniref:hypothetical protein n=1 Tax=uncultured Phocaeicola sp. TaxID=990718 RepID=UPI002585CA94|nr:hypothetical protein [uncultured Phocaeicola sp.]
MIILYVKQAWEMVKQNKLFTSIYVAGTALAIATTMIMAVVYTARNISRIRPVDALRDE